MCLTIEIKRGVLWDLRNLWCGFSARASFNNRVTSTIPEFTTTMPEPTQTGRSTGFWVGIQFDWHNNSARCIAGFKQFNYAGGWEVTSLCIVVSAPIDGQAQNVVNFAFQVQFDIEGQGWSTSQIINILIKVVCTSDPNLVILAWTGDKLSCRQGRVSRMDTRTHTDRCRQQQYLKAKTSLG